MFKDNLIMNNVNQRKTHTLPGQKRSSRRANKTLVEFSIGVIGVIGFMLALLANKPPLDETAKGLTQKNSAVYQLDDNFADDLADKVASMTEVSPMATKVNLVNILF